MRGIQISAVINDIMSNPNNITMQKEQFVNEADKSERNSEEEADGEELHGSKKKGRREETAGIR